MTAPTPDVAAAQHPTPWHVDDTLGWIVDADGNEVCQATRGTPAAKLIVDALAERDSLRARLAAQQPVIDAAEAWRHAGYQSWHHSNALAIAVDAHRAALSGSVEAADEDYVSTCTECGHESDHSGGECMWFDDELVNGESVQRACRCSGSVEAADTPPSGTSGHEADTPAEPGWEVYVTATGSPTGATYDEFGDAQVHVEALNELSGKRRYDIRRRRAREVAGTPAAEPAPACPRCESPQPHLHPAVQSEGEVQPCPDPWHATSEYGREVLARLHGAGAGAPTEPADDTQETSR